MSNAAPIPASQAATVTQNATSTARPDGFGSSGGSGRSGQESTINGLIAAVGKMPIIGLTLSAVGDLLTTAEGAPAVVLGVQTSESQTGCAEMTVFFARGTMESGIGGLVTSPPVFDALSSMLGANAVSVQGVNCGASIEGLLERRDTAGSTTM